jgi:hypothetical protein
MVVCFVVDLWVARGVAGRRAGGRGFELRLPERLLDWDGHKKTLQRTLQGSRDR